MIRKLVSYKHKIIMDLSKYEYKNRKKLKLDAESIVESQPSQSHSFKKSKSQIKSQIKQPLSDPVNTLSKILQWRKNNEAPVDVVGCERLYERNQSQIVWKYQLLISIFLSVQTKDQTTSLVVKRLIKYGLNPTNILNTSEYKLKQLIHEVNFNNKKAKNMLEITRIIHQKGYIPKTLEEITQFPGIGLKIANIYLKVAEGIITGVGVDTHVHRISNRIGWVKTSSPNQTEKQLQNVFDKKYWADINIGLVGFGQVICDAKNPKCSQCVVRKQCRQFNTVYKKRKDFKELF